MAQRYFIDPLPTEGRFVVSGEVAHHLGRVLRAQPGMPVRLGDGCGSTIEATVVAVHRSLVELQVVRLTRTEPLRPRLHVAFAPPRLQRAEWLFEHGTEAGIAVFHPLWTARTRPQGERPDRWRKIVQAAAGQCDRAFVPRVEPAEELAVFLLRSDLPTQRFVASALAPPLEPGQHADATVLLVGPEGGFQADEVALAHAAGFARRSLGPHTLRTETAALVGAALLLLR